MAVNRTEAPLDVGVGIAVGSGSGVAAGVAMTVGRAAISGVTTGASTVMNSVVVHATEPTSANAANPTINRRQSIVTLLKKIRVDSRDQNLRSGAVANDDLIAV